jgi:hypothetical protein
MHVHESCRFLSIEHLNHCHHCSWYLVLTRRRSVKVVSLEVPACPVGRHFGSAEHSLANVSTWYDGNLDKN